MTQAKYAIAVLAGGLLTMAAAPASAFNSNEWGDHWRAPTYELRYNFWRDTASILHVKGGELLCSDGHKIMLPGEEEIKELVNPVWENLRGQGLDNFRYIELSEFHAAENIPHGHYYVLFHDELMGERKASVYDLTASPELIKHLEETVEGLCSGKVKPGSVEMQPDDQRADPPGVLFQRE